MREIETNKNRDMDFRLHFTCGKCYTIPASSLRLHGVFGARHKAPSGRYCAEDAEIALVGNNKLNLGTRALSTRSARRREGVNTELHNSFILKELCAFSPI